MSGQGDPAPPSRGRRVLAKLDWTVSMIATGKPPVSPEEQRRNQAEFLGYTRELSEIAVIVTLLWVLALVAAWRTRLAIVLPPMLLAWGGVMVVFVWSLKLAQIVMIRRRLRPWRKPGARELF